MKTLSLLLFIFLFNLKAENLYRFSSILEGKGKVFKLFSPKGELLSTSYIFKNISFTYFYEKNKKLKKLVLSDVNSSLSFFDFKKNSFKKLKLKEKLSSSLSYELLFSLQKNKFLLTSLSFIDQEKVLYGFKRNSEKAIKQSDENENCTEKDSPLEKLEELHKKLQEDENLAKLRLNVFDESCNKSKNAEIYLEAFNEISKLTGESCNSKDSSYLNCLFQKGLTEELTNIISALEEMLSSNEAEIFCVKEKAYYQGKTEKNNNNKSRFLNKISFNENYLNSPMSSNEISTLLFHELLHVVYLSHTAEPIKGKFLKYDMVDAIEYCCGKGIDVSKEEQELACSILEKVYVNGESPSSNMLGGSSRAISYYAFNKNMFSDNKKKDITKGFEDLLQETLNCNIKKLKTSKNKHCNFKNKEGALDFAFLTAIYNSPKHYLKQNTSKHFASVLKNITEALPLKTQKQLKENIALFAKVISEPDSYTDNKELLNYIASIKTFRDAKFIQYKINDSRILTSLTDENYRAHKLLLSIKEKAKDLLYSDTPRPEANPDPFDNDTKSESVEEYLAKKDKVIEKAKKAYSLLAMASNLASSINNILPHALHAKKPNKKRGYSSQLEALAEFKKLVAKAQREQEKTKHSNAGEKRSITGQKLNSEGRSTKDSKQTSTGKRHFPAPGEKSTAHKAKTDKKQSSSYASNSNYGRKPASSNNGQELYAGAKLKNPNQDIDERYLSLIPDKNLHPLFEKIKNRKELNARDYFLFKELRNNTTFINFLLKERISIVDIRGNSFGERKDFVAQYQFIINNKNGRIKSFVNIREK